MRGPSLPFHPPIHESFPEASYCDSPIYDQGAKRERIGLLKESWLVLRIIHWGRLTWCSVWMMPYQPPKQTAIQAIFTILKSIIIHRCNLSTSAYGTTTTTCNLVSLRLAYSTTHTFHKYCLWINAANDYSYIAWVFYYPRRHRDWDGEQGRWVHMLLLFCWPKCGLISGLFYMHWSLHMQLNIITMISFSFSFRHCIQLWR